MNAPTRMFEASIANQLVICVGALIVIWTFFGWRKGIAPAVAGGACGWIYPEATVLCLGIFLIGSFLKNRQQDCRAEVQEDTDVIDVEFEVRDVD